MTVARLCYLANRSKDLASFAPQLVILRVRTWNEFMKGTPIWATLCNGQAHESIDFVCGARNMLTVGELSVASGFSFSASNEESER